MSFRPNYKADARKQCNKVAARRKREENMVEIQRFRRQETLLKKRREAHKEAHNTQDQTTSLDEKLQSLPATASALASDDIPAKEAAAIHLLKMLTERNPPMDAIIKSGVVPLLADILRREDMPQLQALINANIFPPPLSLLENTQFDIKKDVAWAVSNATSSGSDEQIRYLAIQGCIKPLCDLLTCPDTTTITACLDGLENILRAGETEKNAGLKDVNLYAELIKDADGLDNIEALFIHENTDVYEKCLRILENS